MGLSGADRAVDITPAIVHKFRPLVNWRWANAAGLSAGVTTAQTRTIAAREVSPGFITVSYGHSAGLTSRPPGVRGRHDSPPPRRPGDAAPHRLTTHAARIRRRLRRFPRLPQCLPRLLTPYREGLTKSAMSRTEKRSPAAILIVIGRALHAEHWSASWLVESPRSLPKWRTTWASGPGLGAGWLDRASCLG